MKLLRFIFFLFVLSLLYSCGGGGNSSISPNNPGLSKNDNSLTNELALKRLKGLWKGSLVTYLSGTTTKQCEWDITLNLTATKVPDSNKITEGVFLGSASAELVFSEGKKSEECISDSISIDWSASCFSDEYINLLPDYFNDKYSCYISTDNAGNSKLLYSWGTFNEILTSSFLSTDKSIIYLHRRNRDDPKLSLVRQ